MEDNLRNQIREIFSEVTRYPIKILKDESHFEEELGIDSVKLAEVFAVMQEKLNLPEDNELYEKQFENIAQVAQAISEYNTQVPIISASTVATKTSPVVIEAKQNMFDGKIAFVTGSGRGIGKIIVEKLASLGAFVIVNSFHSRNMGEEIVEKINNNGGKAYHLWGSVANPKQLHKMFDEIENDIGGLDFFISNSSNGTLGPVADITRDDWKKAYRTNVISFQQGAMRASKIMKKRGGGRIVALSSPGARGYIEHLACIATVKAAVESLVRYMATEFSEDNILVNCVAPGAVDGNLVHKFPDSEKLIPHWKSLTPGHELCPPSQIADFIAFLLSEDASAINGSIVDMDGGSSIYTYIRKESFS